MNINFTQLIIKSLENTLSITEQKDFDAWLRIDSNKKQYHKIKVLWDASGTLTYPEIEAHLDVEVAYKNVLERTQFIKTTKKRRSIRPYLVAASMALLMGVFGYWALDFTSADSFTTITADANMEYTLPDNSTIWLSKDSEVAYHNDFVNNRQVKMKGQVMYEVTHNPEKPFTIDAEDMDVTVLGTKFIVSNTFNQTDYVQVINGKVQVDDKKGQSPQLILTKNMTANREAGKMTISDEAYANDMYWASKSLGYNNASLEKIFDELETYFDTTIETNNQFANCKFKGTFTGDGLDDILSTLEVIYQLEINKNIDNIIINGPSCQ